MAAAVLVNALRIASEIIKNAAATVLPWRSKLDYYHDWQSYGEGVFAQHVEGLGDLGFSLAGKHVLEIGPGSTLWAIYLCVARGAATATAVDVCRNLLEDASPSDALDRVRYMVPCTAERIDLPPSSVDLIFSHAVLEHVRAPKLVVAEQWRLLSPGAYVSHQIDTRNHLDFSRPQDHHNIPEIVWRLMTWNRSAYTNRYTIEMWIDAFLSQGFDLVHAHETASLEQPTKPDGGLFICAKKPADVDKP